MTVRLSFCLPCCTFEARLTGIINSLNEGNYVEPSKLTLADYVRGRVEQWHASGEISAKTVERYRELVENQIVPHLGAKLVQKLKPEDVERWHSTLKIAGRKNGKGGISARTIGHAHRVLGKALKDAVKNDKAQKNAAALQRAPKVDSEEMIILTANQIPTVTVRLRGHRLYPAAMTSLFTGMRRGEVLALRRRDVDLDAKVARVRDALEETREHGVRNKGIAENHERRPRDHPA